MHADCLDPERLDNFSFMAMTPDGPMSMCLHNARKTKHSQELANMGLRLMDEGPA